MVQDVLLLGVDLFVLLLVCMVYEIEEVCLFKIECVGVVIKLCVLIEVGGDVIEGFFDGEEVIILLVDLDVGVIGIMMSVMIFDQIKLVLIYWQVGDWVVVIVVYVCILFVVNYENW